jgi:uncharacterized membrane protein
MRILILALLSAFFAALAPIAIRLGFRETGPILGPDTPLIAMTIRSISMTIILFVLILITNKSSLITKVPVGPITFFALNGIFGVLAGLSFFFALFLSRGGTPEIYILSSVSPLFVVFFSIILLGEMELIYNPTTLVGILITTIGIMLLGMQVKGF